jgi:hypothetical protein
MQQFLEEGHFVQGHNLEYHFIAGHVLICGQIACLGDIVITVEKALEVLDPDAAPLEARVQTVEYSYNASVKGQHSFLRYDNQHPHDGHADDHHRHDFNWKNGKDLKGSPSYVGVDGWPTLSEFIELVRGWYNDNHLQLPNPNGVPKIDERFTPRIFGMDLKEALDDDA